ncbi:MAG: hypothetical protein JXB10_10260 [Pirellulales bacterium]|nr:hypothetical protein [Pirellulales bacterium]
MSIPEVKKTPVFGFLTVIADPQHGLFGGYLLLNRLGRPLEFHCTAPVKPNRAQEILYGPTLDAFLYGEQIGQTLLDHATAQSQLLCTDQAAVMCVRQHVEIPVVLVLPDGEGAESGAFPENGQKTYRVDPAHAPEPHWTYFTCGPNRLAVPAEVERDRHRVTEQWSALPETFDLGEPFVRIREAIAEAQQAMP